MNAILGEGTHKPNITIRADTVNYSKQTGLPYFCTSDSRGILTADCGDWDSVSQVCRSQQIHWLWMDHALTNLTYGETNVKHMMGGLVGFGYYIVVMDHHSSPIRS